MVGERDPSQPLVVYLETRVISSVDGLGEPLKLPPLVVTGSTGSGCSYIIIRQPI